MNKRVDRVKSREAKKLASAEKAIEQKNNQQMVEATQGKEVSEKKMSKLKDKEATKVENAKKDAQRGARREVRQAKEGANKKVETVKREENAKMSDMQKKVDAEDKSAMKSRRSPRRSWLSLSFQKKNKLVT